ncbi:hypothetical protein V5799_024050 [Amblyomma americanum]|uniref:Uncharacterized protein n=1 Tax=Amblyomma americanum TaxID=6943 RepID=A0AAQ4ED74_AMBAM
MSCMLCIQVVGSRKGHHEKPWRKLQSWMGGGLRRQLGLIKKLCSFNRALNRLHKTLRNAVLCLLVLINSSNML